MTNRSISRDCHTSLGVCGKTTPPPHFYIWILMKEKHWTMRHYLEVQVVLVSLQMTSHMRNVRGIQTWHRNIELKTGEEYENISSRNGELEYSSWSWTPDIFPAKIWVLNTGPISQMFEQRCCQAHVSGFLGNQELREAWCKSELLTNCFHNHWSDG